MFEMKDINLYFIRHGESEANIIPDLIGQASDTKLTDNGISQSNLLGHRFLKQGIIFDEIISSTYLRARTTAEIVRDIIAYKPELFLTDALVEYSPGDWRGKKRSEIYSDLNSLKSIAYLNMGFLFPNGESYNQVERRASIFLEDNIFYNKNLLTKAEDKELNIALFSHGMTIKCILHYMLGFDPSMLWKMRCDNTSIAHVIYNDKGFFINSVNDIGHLL